jgi:putative ABC transport system ATP-binding protein
MNGGPILSVRGLSKTYRMGEVEVEALRGIDLDVAEGKLVVILGPSGSGKSTLLNVLGGLDTASAGEVRFRELDLTHADEGQLTRYRRHHVGFVFQFYNLVPSLTARENVALAAELAREPFSPEEALARVGLAGRMDHFPAQMSGGEQQRVAIARAVVKRPDVLMCDEPTGALDVRTGKLVLAVLAEINRELGTTTILITHNAAIAGMADEVLVVHDGLIARRESNARRVPPEEIVW